MLPLEPGGAIVVPLDSLDIVEFSSMFSVADVTEAVELSIELPIDTGDFDAGMVASVFSVTASVVMNDDWACVNDVVSSAVVVSVIVDVVSSLSEQITSCWVQFSISNVKSSKPTFTCPFVPGKTQRLERGRTLAMAVLFIIQAKSQLQDNVLLKKKTCRVSTTAERALSMLPHARFPTVFEWNPKLSTLMKL